MSHHPVAGVLLSPRHGNNLEIKMSNMQKIYKEIIFSKKLGLVTLKEQERLIFLLIQGDDVGAEQELKEIKGGRRKTKSASQR
jgi:hypothetical protein